jgi:hypothetical protein
VDISKHRIFGKMLNEKKLKVFFSGSAELMELKHVSE